MTRVAPIGDVVRACMESGWSVIETARCSWRVRHDRHPGVDVTIAVREDWMHLDAPVRPVTDDWGLLVRSGELPHPWKVVRGPSSEPRLRAEFVWSEPNEDSPPGARHGQLRGVLERFGNAFGRVSGNSGSASGKEGGGDARPEPGGDDTAALPALVADAGWPATERSADVVNVLLGDRGGRDAQVARGPDGGLYVRVRMASPGNLAAPCRQAMAYLTLRVLGMVRLVRGMASGGQAGEEAELRFEVAAGPDACASDLHDALSALSVASSLAVREIAFLCDERAARNYLATELRREHDLVIHS